MSDRLFLIRTILSKCPDINHVLNFTVECREESPSDSSPLRPPIATVGGFLIEPGYLPEGFDDLGYWEAFDMRSGHADEAYSILVEHRDLIAKALPASDLLETGSAIAHLECAWVDPDHRRHGLALRLMREAKHVLGRYGLLVILKAHPDGNDVGARECLALASYYQRDQHLGLRPLSSSELPGWLVAHWEAPDAYESDQNYWTNDLVEAE